jgi:pimeloyl-ACP methyl ester carboxylesterase
MNSETVRFNGIEIYYKTYGAGEPLLLLHGGGGCHSDWQYAGRDQLLSEYLLIAPDPAATAGRQIPKRQLHTGKVRWTCSHCSIISASGDARRSV